MQPGTAGDQEFYQPLRYASDQDSKQVVADLKKIYQAATVLDAEQALEDFAQVGLGDRVHGDPRGVEEQRQANG